MGSLKWAPQEQFFVISSEKYLFSKKIVKITLIFGARWLLLKNAHVSPKCFQPACNNFWLTLYMSLTVPIYMYIFLLGEGRLGCFNKCFFKTKIFKVCMYLDFFNYCFATFHDFNWKKLVSDAQGRTSCVSVSAMPSNKPKNVGGCYI